MIKQLSSQFKYSFSLIRYLPIVILGHYFKEYEVFDFSILLCLIHYS